MKALTILSQGRSLLGFLLHQRKGPLQFLVTYALSWYDRQFRQRIPFPVAVRHRRNSVGLVLLLFNSALFGGKSCALRRHFFSLVNGIIVGLSRIVQYQTFVMLGTVLCLYWLTLAVNTERYRITGLYLASFAALVSCLAHFDGFFVIPPAILLLYRWMCRNTSNRLRRHILFSVTIFVIPNLLFYLSLYFNLASETVGYWQGRMVGKRNKTTKLFTLYNGWPAIYIYLLFGAIGIAHQCKKEQETYFYPYPLHSACPASRWDAASSGSSISFAMPGLGRRGFEFFRRRSVVRSTGVEGQCGKQSRDPRGNRRAEEIHPATLSAVDRSTLSVDGVRDEPAAHSHLCLSVAGLCVRRSRIARTRSLDGGID